MKNLYLEVKEINRKEMESFPMFFAFNREQFKKGLLELGVKETEVVSIGSGGCIRESDTKAYIEMSKRMTKREEDNFNNKIYLEQMFNYELSNHEYCITGDVDDTLEACGVTREMLKENKIINEALNKALSKY